MKFIELRKRGLCLFLAATMIAGSSITTLAAEGDGQEGTSTYSDSGDNGSGSGDNGNGSGDEGDTAESSTPDEVKDAGGAAKEAEDAAANKADEVTEEGGADKVEEADKDEVKDIADAEKEASDKTGGAGEKLEEAEDILEDGKEEIEQGSEVVIPVTVPAVDEEGNQLTDKEGNPVRVQVYETDEEGNVVYETDEEGNQIPKPLTQVVDLDNMYETDEEGNVVYEMDEEGNLVLDEEGNQIPVYTEGYLAATEFFAQEAAKNAQAAADAAAAAEEAANAAGTAANNSTSATVEGAAEEAAAQAGILAGTAQTEADTAQEAADQAYDDFLTAKAAYEAAQEIADKAQADAEAKLLEGKADAQAALLKAQEAQKVASELKEKYDAKAIEANQTLTDKQEELAKAEEELKQASREWEAAKGERDKLDDVAKKADAAVTDAQNAVKIDEENVDDAQKNLDVAQAKLTEAKKALDAAEAELKAAGEEQSEAADYLDSMRKALETAENALNAAQDEVDQIKKNNDVEYAEAIKAASDAIKNAGQYEYYTKVDKLNELVLKHKISTETNIDADDITVKWTKSGVNADNYCTVTYTDSEGNEVTEYYNYHASVEENSTTEIKIFEKTFTKTVTYSDQDGSVISEVVTDEDGNVVGAGKVTIGETTYEVTTETEQEEVSAGYEYTYWRYFQGSIGNEVVRKVENGKIKYYISGTDTIVYQAWKEGEWKYTDTVNSTEDYVELSSYGDMVIIYGKSYVIEATKELFDKVDVTKYYYTTVKKEDKEVDVDAYSYEGTEEKRITGSYDGGHLRYDYENGQMWVLAEINIDGHNVRKWAPATYNFETKKYDYVYTYEVKASVAIKKEGAEVKSENGETYVKVRDEWQKVTGETKIKETIQEDVEVKHFIDFSAFNKLEKVTIGEKDTVYATSNTIANEKIAVDYQNALGVLANAKSEKETADTNVKNAKAVWEAKAEEYNRLKQAKEDAEARYGTASKEVERHNDELTKAQEALRISSEKLAEAQKKAQDARAAADAAVVKAEKAKDAYDQAWVKVHGIHVGSDKVSLGLRDQVEEAKEALELAKKQQKYAVDLLDTADTALEKAQVFADAYDRLVVSDDATAEELEAAYVKVQEAYRSWVAAQATAEAAQTVADQALAAYQQAVSALVRFNVPGGTGGSGSGGGGATPAAVPTVLTTLEALPVPMTGSLGTMAPVVEEPETATTSEVRTGRRGVTATPAVGEENEEVVEIADVETPQAATIEAATGDETPEADTKEIEDEETALAASLDEKNMSWWWLLILVLVSGGSYAGYRQYKKKKEENLER